MNIQPGIMEESLVALKIKSDEALQQGNQIFCNLVFDEMSIRKKIEWDGHQTYGYVAMMTRIQSDCLQESKDCWMP